MRKKIGVLNSGGDCPGLNAVLRAVARTADHYGMEVLGFREGFEGLLPPGNFLKLDRSATAGIMHLGGTILGTTNKGHFVAKIGAGDKAAIPQDVIQKAHQTFTDLGLHALVVVGGDGSLSTGLQLSENGMPVVGVPKTIDNDLEATAITFGFDSAVSCVVDAMDRLHTTATSHRRVMVLEVMGRHTGWIALYGGMAGGADVILIPEIPFALDKIADEVKRRDRFGAKSTMVVIAEGACPQQGKQYRQSVVSGEYRLGGVGEMVGREIANRTGKDTRVCTLGHLQRGGAPTPVDRILGTRFGIHAVELIQQGKFGMMVSYMGNHITEVPITEAVNKLRRVAPDCQMVRDARTSEISFGDSSAFQTAPPILHP